MDRSARRSPETDEITVRESDGYFVATDEETGVSSQGETKSEALENLADALALYQQPVSERDEEGLEPAEALWFST